MSEEQQPEPMSEEERAALDRQYENRRRLSLRRTEEAVVRMLDNSDGFIRLKAISDEEWQAAVDSDGAKVA